MQALPPPGHKLLGAGRNGEVYSYDDGHLGTVAVKVAPMKPGNPPLLEAEMMMKVITHPNIVKIKGWACNGGNLHVYMECVGEGLTLMDLLGGRTPWSALPDATKKPSDKATEHFGLTERNAWLLWRKVASAVAHCHGLNVAHRDVKLDNILLRQNPYCGADAPLGEQVDVALGDFGYSCRFGRERLEEYPGTFSYAAPELLTAIPYQGDKPDVWALGVVLYMLLTGYYPFGGKHTPENVLRIINRDCKFDRPGAPISPRARQVLEKMLTPFWPARLGMRHVMTYDWVTVDPDVASEKKA